MPFVEMREFGEFYPNPIHVILEPGLEYAPDRCFIAAGRDEDPDAAGFRGVPHLIIKVISEPNRRHDTVVKFRDYERFGVKEYRLSIRASRVFNLNAAGRYQLAGPFAPGERVVSDVFPELQLDPAALFGKR